MLAARWNLLERHLQRDAHGWTCFWANLLRYALHFGRSDDPRLEAVTALLVDEALQTEWRCEYSYDRPCDWGAARMLWAFAAIPAHRRSSGVQNAIQAGLNFLLEDHNLLKNKSPDITERSISSLWFRLSFPLFYQADVLFVLRALSELDKLDHPGAQQALEWLQDRRSKNGLWRGSSPYRQRTWRTLGGPSETDRWVSLQAALVLKSTGRLD
jgi:hypothetical protein